MKALPGRTDRADALPAVRVNADLNILELAQNLAASGYFADARDASQAVVKILYGQEIGIGPIAAMMGVYIYKGRVSLYAHLMASLVKRSGVYDYRIREHTDQVCVLECFQNGESVGLSAFSMDDARRAKLSGDNWTHYPKNMLFARALSNLVRFYCPHLTNGPAYTPEELGAVIDGETGEILELPSPDPVSPRKAGDSFAAPPRESTPAAPSPGGSKSEGRLRAERNYEALIEEAQFLDMDAGTLARFQAFDAAVADPGEFKQMLDELRSLVRLRKLDLEADAGEEQAEARTAHLEMQMDRAVEHEE